MAIKKTGAEMDVREMLISGSAPIASETVNETNAQEFSEAPLQKGEQPSEQITEIPSVQNPDVLDTNRRARRGQGRFTYDEPKSKQYHILVRPSVLAMAKAKADKLGLSYNEFIHRAIEFALLPENEEAILENIGINN